MNILILIFIVLIVILVPLFLHIAKISSISVKKEYLPYVKRNYLMSKAEHEFFKVLQEVVQDKYYIIPQVQLSKIVDVNKYEKLQQTYRNKIDRKSVDFVLFEKETFSPYLVIELDEESHQLPNREDRDHFVNAIMAKTGLRIEHVKTSFSYEIRSLDYIIAGKKPD